MWVEIGRWIVILFGLFFIFIAGIILLKPKLARETLRKAGSTNFINYTEISLRIIPAIGLILAALQAGKNPANAPAKIKIKTVVSATLKLTDGFNI